MARAAIQETTDARILSIAADHIRRFGLNRMTVVGVAAEAGMSHANVYRYFPSKELLVDALTEQWLKPLEAALHEIADGPDPAYDKLERILEAIYRGYRNKLDGDPHLFEIFAEAMRDSRALSRRHRAKVQAEIARTLDEGMSGGVFRQGDPRRALGLVFDGLHRFLNPVALLMDREVPRNALDSRFEKLTGVILRALPGRY